jgi:hypothetical protein
MVVSVLGEKTQAFKNKNKVKGQEMKQEITSRGTSLNQIPAGYVRGLKYGYLKNKAIFDFGCGRYLNKVVNWANDFLNSEIVGYDPYNRTAEENRRALNNSSRCDVAVCNNVLNVLCDGVLESVIDSLVTIMTRADIPTVFITVYEGDKSGRGRKTKVDCYQRNMTKKAYVSLLSKFFSEVTVRYNVITCSLH